MPKPVKPPQASKPKQAPPGLSIASLAGERPLESGDKVGEYITGHMEAPGGRIEVIITGTVDIQTSDPRVVVVRQG